MEIGELIRSYRKKHGLSMKSIADILDLAPQAISQYERGLRCLTFDTLIKIMDILNISPNDLPEDIKQKYFQNINTLLDIKRLSVQYHSYDSIETFLNTHLEYDIYFEQKNLKNEYNYDKLDTNDFYACITDKNSKITKKLEYDEFEKFMSSVKKFMDYEFSNL